MVLPASVVLIVNVQDVKVSASALQVSKYIIVNLILASLCS